jgi:transcription initiation factor TFIIIB Brf1 subunit/transcription initiation factor TFIIB
MPRWKTIDFKCNPCGIVETFVEDAENVEEHACRMCGETMEKQFAAPKVLVASYPDGHCKDPATKALQQSYKLEGEMYSQPTNKRKEYKKEIDTLRKVKPRKRD